MSLGTRTVGIDTPLRGAILACRDVQSSQRIKSWSFWEFCDDPRAATRCTVRSNDVHVRGNTQLDCV